MRNLLLKIGISAASAVGTALAFLAPAAHAETFSTTSLGTAIDAVSGTTYDYFTVLIAKFWPYLLGATLLVGVIVFGRWVIHKFFGGK